MSTRADSIIAIRAVKNAESGNNLSNHYKKVLDDIRTQVSKLLLYRTRQVRDDLLPFGFMQIRQQNVEETLSDGVRISIKEW